MAAPVCRSRTDAFLAKRRNLRGAGRTRATDHEQLVDVELAPSGTLAMPEWVDSLEEVREMQAGVKDSLAKLQELHRKRMLPTTVFGGGENETVEIQMASAQLSSQFKKIDAAVKRFSVFITAARDPEEKTTVTNAQLSLATDMSDLWRQFRDMQKRFLEAEKERRKTSVLQQSEEARRWEEQDAREMQEEALRQKDLTAEQIETIRLTNDMLSQRDSELKDILRGLVEVQQMFQDLNMMVIDQGTMLDRIDANISRTQTEVEDGLRHIKKAEERSRHTRFKTCVCLLFVLIVFFLIALIATPSDDTPLPPPPPPPPPATPWPTPVPTPIPTPVPTPLPTTPSPA